MSAAKSVTATFVPTSASYTLAVTKAGTRAGTVSSSPMGISCGADCTETYPSGTMVTLTATPATGYQVSSWGGACSGTASTCTLTMSADRAVSVTFAQTQHTLTVTAPSS